MDLVIRSFSYERQPRIINYSPTSTTPDAERRGRFRHRVGDPRRLHRAVRSRTSSNQYLNEYIVGGEREVMPDVALGVKGIYRNYGRVIEDFLCADDGTYCIGNPGQGIMKDIFTLDYSTTFPAPKPKRTYKGVQFDATKRFSNNWQAIASYIYSKLDGNYDGEYAPFTNVGADPNISAAYDYYDFFTNGSDLSKITNQRPAVERPPPSVQGLGHRTTRRGSCRRRLRLLAQRHAADALRLLRRVRPLRVLPHRARRRGTDAVELRRRRPLRLSDRTPRQRRSCCCSTSSTSSTRNAPCCSISAGASEDDNTSPTPVNPDYGKPFLRTPPTSARVGVRITF